MLGKEILFMDEQNMKIKARENFKLIILSTLLVFSGGILLFSNINSASGVENMNKNYLYVDENYLSADEKKELAQTINNAIDVLVNDKEPDEKLFGQEWIMGKQIHILNRFFTNGMIGIKWFRSDENFPWDDCVITFDQNKLFTSVPEEFFSNALNLKLENVTSHKTKVIEVDSNDNDIEVEKPYLSYNYKPIKKNGVLVSFIVMGNEQGKYPINFIRVEIKKNKQN